MKKLLILTMLVILSTTVLAVDMPKTIDYQSAEIRDSSGNTINEQLGLNFSIHTNSSGTGYIWQENTSKYVSNGVMSTTLGATSAIDLSWFLTYPGQLYMGINVVGDGQMNPRLNLSRFTPYSAVAWRALGLNCTNCVIGTQVLESTLGIVPNATNAQTAGSLDGYTSTNINSRINLNNASIIELQGRTDKNNASIIELQGRKNDTNLSLGGRIDGNLLINADSNIGLTIQSVGVPRINMYSETANVNNYSLYIDTGADTLILYDNTRAKAIQTWTASGRVLFDRNSQRIVLNPNFADNNTQAELSTETNIPLCIRVANEEDPIVCFENSTHIMDLNANISMSFGNISSGRNPDGEEGITIKSVKSADFYLGDNGYFNFYNASGNWIAYIRESDGLLNTVRHGQSDNWYAAYNWGNHALAGYAVNASILNYINSDLKKGNTTVEISVVKVDNSSYGDDSSLLAGQPGSYYLDDTNTNLGINTTGLNNESGNVGLNNDYLTGIFYIKSLVDSAISIVADSIGLNITYHNASVVSFVNTEVSALANNTYTVAETNTQLVNLNNSALARETKYNTTQVQLDINGSSILAGGFLGVSGNFLLSDFITSGDGGHNMNVSYDESNNAFKIEASAGRDIVFQSAGNNVGIGQLYPSAKLEVDGDIKADIVIVEAAINHTGTGSIIVREFSNGCKEWSNSSSVWLQC